MGNLRSPELFQLFHRALNILSIIYLKEPDLSVLKELRDKEIFIHWPSLESGKDHQQGIELTTGCLSSLTSRDLPRLTTDYTRLFSGFQRLLAPPYESIYLGKDHILFDGPTLKVREWYRRHQLTVEELNRIPDDHLGLELSFLAHLCRERTNAGNQKSIIENELKTFLDNHLLRWLPLFVQRVMTHGGTEYYRGVALLTRSTVTDLRQWLAIRCSRN